MVMFLAWHRQQSVIDELDDAPLHQVHECHHTVDRVRPRVVLGPVLYEREDPQQAPALFTGEAVLAR